MKAVMLPTINTSSATTKGNSTIPSTPNYDWISNINCKHSYFRTAGIEEFILIEGFGIHKIENLITNYNGIKIIPNPLTQNANSLFALWMAMCEINENEDVVIINGYKVFNENTLKTFEDAGNDKSYFLVNSKDP